MSLRSVLACLCACLFACLPARAAGEADTRQPSVREYVARCASPSATDEQCSGPIEMLWLVSSYPVTTTAGTATASICLPSADKFKDVPTSLIAWMSAHPELQDAPELTGLMTAAKALYPCPPAPPPQQGDFEAARDVRATVLAQAIPMGMSNVEGVTDNGPDVLLGLRLAKDKTGKIVAVPDMFMVMFNDTGEAMPDFGGKPVVLANVFFRRLVHDKPPSGEDDAVAKTGIPTFFVGARGQDVWEIGRHAGAISVRLVGDDGIGPWEEFESDPTRYHVYAQHFLNGRTAGQNFSDPRVAAMAVAACAGDSAAVAKAAKAGANPNGKGIDGDTPIFWAIDCASETGVAALLRTGADPNYKLPGRPYTQPGGYAESKELHYRTHQYSPLFAAVLAHDLPMVKALLAHGGDPNSYEDDRQDNTALWISVQQANMLAYEKHDQTGWAIYEALLDSDKDLNHADDSNHTLATQLATFGRYDLLEEVLKRGYDYDLADLGMIIQNENDADSPPRARVIALLKAKGVCFPLEVVMNRDVTITMKADESLRVRWDKPPPGCLAQPDGPSLEKKGDPLYSDFVRRVGGIKPGETKSTPR